MPGLRDAMQVGFTDPSRFSQDGQSIADDRGNGSLLMGTSTAAPAGGAPPAEPHLEKSRPQSNTNAPGHRSGTGVQKEQFSP